MQFGTWIPALGFAGILVLCVLGNVMEMKIGKGDPGITTEVAILLMYVVGALLAVGDRAVAVAVGGAIAILLHLKPEMHTFASRMEREDLKAIMQFALLTFVVLPILPDRSYGPLGAFNPFTAWLLVVLIVGISLAGYLIYRFVGARAGVMAGGLLGGLISSTATTVSYSRLSRMSDGLPASAATVIALASTVMYVRVLILIGVVSSSFLWSAAVPIGALAVLAIVIALLMLRRSTNAPEAPIVHRNPTELKTALAFAALYSVVLLLVAVARQYWGNAELLLIAGISGLTDVDPITVSTAQLVKAGQLHAVLGWKMIVLALVANTVFKAGVAWFLAGRRLFVRLLLPFGVSALAGLAVLLFG